MLTCIGRCPLPINPQSEDRRLSTIYSPGELPKGCQERKDGRSLLGRSHSWWVALIPSRSLSFWAALILSGPLLFWVASQSGLLSFRCRSYNDYKWLIIHRKKMNVGENATSGTDTDAIFGYHPTMK
ncbi:hypothetical protein BC937DRAFT_89801 [Endogone sp. FLAS-F59071]|nr:hypothetical protein BC937DRAFT_89801 [Endogone sp. FLAS-F59071]|eukprot:RUS22289.1 hypothetical protein BC937DRAFT_89801 [Endogone sp. FLAS-F59071]